jgi:hypothetical protein
MNEGFLVLTIRIVVFWVVTLCRRSVSAKDGGKMFLQKKLVTSYKTTWYLFSKWSIINFDPAFKMWS